MPAASHNAPFKIAMATLLSAAIIGLFAWLAWQAKVAPAPIDRIEYTRILCASPTGKSRIEFLDELRYLGLPETIELRAENCDRELTTLFERHPQVDKVLSIQERRSPGDGQVELVVEVRFR